MNNNEDIHTFIENWQYIFEEVAIVGFVFSEPQ